MRYLRELKKEDLNGKTVLLRVDFNIETAKEKFRLAASLSTIRFLRARGARVVLLSHRGRPTKSPASRQANSLRLVLPFLRHHIGGEIVFFSHFDFPKIRASIAKSKNALFLIENLRFLDGEKNGDPAFAKSLASLGNIYVNDAFSVCHRENASVSVLPKYLPSFAGIELEKEIRMLHKALAMREKPLVVILGGAKVPDKIGVIKHLLPKTAYFLVGGIIANTFLKARGSDIEKSPFDKTMLKTAQGLLKNPKIILPMDFVSKNHQYFDIGPLTVKLFSEKLRGAKMVFWNGPLGFFEDKRFRRGSTAVAQTIAKSAAFTVVGGGETTDLIRTLGLEKKMGFLSTGGGAMLEFLAGKKLPGIQALN